MLVAAACPKTVAQRSWRTWLSAWRATPECKRASSTTCTGLKLLMLQLLLLVALLLGRLKEQVLLHLRGAPFLLLLWAVTINFNTKMRAPGARLGLLVVVQVLLVQLPVLVLVVLHH